MNPATDLPLHRKIEKAVTLWLQKKQRAGKLRGFTIQEGHTADEPEIPWLCVYCRNPRPADDMPAETRIKSAELVFHQKTHADDESRTVADSRLDELDELIPESTQACPSELHEFLNPPTSGPDTRQVRELYVYGIHEGEQPEEAEKNHWNDQRIFEVICQNWDPDPV